MGQLKVIMAICRSGRWRSIYSIARKRPKLGTIAHSEVYRYPLRPRVAWPEARERRLLAAPRRRAWSSPPPPAVAMGIKVYAYIARSYHRSARCDVTLADSPLPARVFAIGFDEAAGGARAGGGGEEAGGGLPRPRRRHRRQPQHLPVPREFPRPWRRPSLSYLLYSLPLQL